MTISNIQMPGEVKCDILSSIMRRSIGKREFEARNRRSEDCLTEQSRLLQSLVLGRLLAFRGEIAHYWVVRRSVARDATKGQCLGDEACSGDLDLDGQIRSRQKGICVFANKNLSLAGEIEHIPTLEVRHANPSSRVQLQVAECLIETVAGVLWIADHSSQVVVRDEPDEAGRATAVVRVHVFSLRAGNEEEVCFG